MSFPTLTVEAAFGEDPLAASPTWVDITDHVIAMHVITGKQQDLNEYQPGVLELDLDNSGRRFDPLHVDGPYYGQLLPKVRLRVVASWNSVDYDVFTGFVDGWPQSYKPPADAVCHVTVTDLFKLLQRGHVEQVEHDLAVEASSPVAYYKLDEGEGVVQMGDSSGNANHGQYTSTGRQSTADPVIPYTTQGSRLVTIPPVANAPLAAALSGSAWSIEWWCQFDTPEGDLTTELGAFFQVITQGSYIPTGVLGVQAADVEITCESYATTDDGDTHITVMIRTSGATYGYRSRVCRTQRYLFDGHPHHFMVTKSGTTVHGYIDGQDTNESSVGDGTVPSSTPASAPELFWQTSGVTRVRVGTIAVYGVALTQSDALAHYEAALEPWSGDRTGERIDRILDQLNIPAGLRDIDTGITVLGPERRTDGTPLEWLRQIEATEQGALFCNHRDGGKLRFRDRRKPLTANAHTISQARFSDEEDPELGYDDLVIEYDDQLVVNRVEVTWVGGTLVREDTASQDVYGVQTRQIDTVLETAVEAETLGDWILEHYAEVFLRVRSLTINPNRRGDTAAAAAWEAALGLSIGDRVTVRRLPQNVGLEIEEELLIEGIEHYAAEGVDTWTTTFSFSKAEATGSYWILGTSRLEVDAVLAY